jgi:transcriptional regulator with GAF, ATPase, and Fis domain
MSHSAEERGPLILDKERVARASREQSARSEQPFVCVNCGVLPDAPLESKLFGYERGALTGARAGRPGRFSAGRWENGVSRRGGRALPAFQVKLPPALQEGRLRPLGGTGTVRGDVRIIAATNRDLR